jgi:hypothetical protein
LEGEIEMSDENEQPVFEALILVGPPTPMSEAPLDEEEPAVAGDEDDPTFAQPNVPARLET